MVSLKIWENNMEVKRICQWCGKPFIAQKLPLIIVAINVPIKATNIV